MRTVITFADLYREDPVVLAARWPEFVVLFNSQDDTIRVRQHWDPVAEPADFVLRVARKLYSGSEGWEVHQHEDSPASMVLPHDRSFGRDGHTDDPHVRVDSGGLVYFTYRPQYVRGGIGMMLHCEDHHGHETGPVPKGQFKKPTLKNLPAEIHRMLLGKLPVYETLHVLPYVSTKMLNVVRAGGDWKRVDLVHEKQSMMSSIPSLSDVRTFVDLARETCTSLNFGFRRSEVQEHPWWSHVPTACTTVCWEVQWPCVTELLLERDIDGLDPHALKGGLRKGNFPVLKVLKLLPSKGLSWNVLEGCSLPNLIHLEIAIGALSQPIKDRRAFYNSFSLLKTLCVFVNERHCWFWETNEGLLFPRPQLGDGFAFLPNLETLTIGGIPIREELSRDWECVQRQVEVFSRTRVTRLRLFRGPEKFEENESVCDVPGDWLFATFTHLSVVCFDPSICLDWSSVSESSLKGLIHLCATLRHPKEIPFKKMVNLEAAYIHFAHGQRCLELEGLNGLPKLVTLKVSSYCPVWFEELKVAAESSLCNIRSLDVSDCVTPWKDQNVEMELFKALPNLTRLVMPRSYDDCYPWRKEEEISSVIKELKSRVEVHVPIFSADRIGAFMSLFPDNSWDAFLLATSCWDCQDTLFRYRKVKEALGKDMFVFDDAFFCSKRRDCHE